MNFIYTAVLFSIVVCLSAQSKKDYYKYLDTVNAGIDYKSFGSVPLLKRSARSFGEFQPKPYHLVFNFNYDYIKDQFPVFIKEIESTIFIDSLLIDNRIRKYYKNILYLGVDVPFELQIAVIRALLTKIGIVDEVVLLRKEEQIGQTREIIIGGGGYSFVQEQCYLRKFKNIRLLALAKNKVELIQLFENLNEGYSQY